MGPNEGRNCWEPRNSLQSLAADFLNLRNNARTAKFPTGASTSKEYSIQHLNILDRTNRSQLCEC